MLRLLCRQERLLVSEDNRDHRIVNQGADDTAHRGPYIYEMKR
jgi:hypothetical protein